MSTPSSPPRTTQRHKSSHPNDGSADKFNVMEDSTRRDNQNDDDNDDEIDEFNVEDEFEEDSFVRDGDDDDDDDDDDDRVFQEEDDDDTTNSKTAANPVTSTPSTSTSSSDNNKSQPSTTNGHSSVSKPSNTSSDSSSSVATVSSSSSSTSSSSTPVASSTVSTSTPAIPSSSSSSSSAATTTTSSSSSVSSPPTPFQPTSKTSSNSKRSIQKTSLMRLMSDFKSMESDSPEGISASPLDMENMYVWRACIFGPPDTPWEGGVFQLQLHFPQEYPQKPPTVRFISKMFHPNVFADGTLCLDIIQDRWSPVHSVATILTSVQSLLTDPNPASPANPEAAGLMANDPKEYRKRVRACAAKATA